MNHVSGSQTIGSLAVNNHTAVIGDTDLWIIAADEDAAGRLLNVLIPEAAEWIRNPTMTVEMEAVEDELSGIRFVAAGSVNSADSSGNASNKASDFSLTAELTVNENSYHPAIPQAVKTAVSEKNYGNAAELTADLVHLLTAWAKHYSADNYSGQLTLSADCGPLLVSESLNLYSTTVDSTAIGSIQKNGLALYFTDDKICGQNGLTLTASEQKLADSVKLLPLAYEICQNGNFTATGDEDGDEFICTLSLDKEGMKAVAYAIAPEAEKLGIQFTEGQVQVTVCEDTLRTISFSCAGNLKIVLTETPVTLTAEVVFDEDAEEMTVPEKVREALLQ